MRSWKNSEILEDEPEYIGLNATESAKKTVVGQKRIVYGIGKQKEEQSYKQRRKNKFKNATKKRKAIDIGVKRTAMYEIGECFQE